MSSCGPGAHRHPDGTEVDPAAWDVALHAAVADAGGLADVSAIAVGGQQHGMVLLDDDGAVVRPALLWNDTRSARAADELVAELGAQAWADATGSVPVASFTVTKLRWTAEHDADSAHATASVCLPHDWLTARLRGSTDDLTTDRGDASGTGYWSPSTGEYRADLLALAFGRVIGVPRVAQPFETVGEVAASWGAAPGAVLAPGTGDNMAAALGLGAQPGDVVVSLGTSGTAFAVSETATHDTSGAVAGLRRRDRPLPPARLHPQRRPGPRRRTPDARRLHGDLRLPRAVRARRRGRHHAAALPRRRAHARTVPTPPGSSPASPSATGRRRTSPAPRSRACSAASPTPSTRSSPRASRSGG